MDSSDENDYEDEDPDVRYPGARFLWAAQHNKRSIIKTLYKEKGREMLRHTDDDGYTALHRASYNNHADIVQYLLKKGADIHATTAEGWMPLHSACRWNSADCVEVLLAWGANVNAVTEGGQTPLHLAAFGRRARESLQLLFMHPHIQPGMRNCQGDTPRDIALRNNNCVDLFDVVEPSLCDLK